MDGRCCLPRWVLLVVHDPMKVGDWVMWKNGTRAGQITWLDTVAHVKITATSPNKLSETVYTLPYGFEELTVIPEAIAKIINS